MDGQILSMSMKERERLKVFSRVEAGELKLVEGADILGMSYRQGQRMMARYRAEGDGGIVHRARGRPSNRGAGKEVREAVLARYMERYGDFGPTLAAEKFLEEGLEVDHETLRRWLMEAGLWKAGRRRAKHRSWRERRHHFGEMVQMDGSDHDWFEGRSGKCSLVNMTDDATSVREGRFSEAETTESTMRVLQAWIEKYGIPMSVYVDKKTVYVVDEKARERARDEGREALTQFGRACKKLGIRIITANSPQAKGRIERGHRVYQDRLVKELRLEGISTMEEANRLLETGFLDDLNERFSVSPAEGADYHRSAKGIDLDALFCIEEERSVMPDWTVRFENRFFQLTAPHTHKGMRGRGKVLVQRRLDQSLHFQFRGEYLEYSELPERPQPIKQAKKKKRRPARPIMEKYVPRPDHPWKLAQIGKGSPLQQL
jgi:transposase